MAFSWRRRLPKGSSGLAGLCVSACSGTGTSRKRPLCRIPAKKHVTGRSALPGRMGKDWKTPREAVCRALSLLLLQMQNNTLITKLHPISQERQCTLQQVICTRVASPGPERHPGYARERVHNKDASNILRMLQIWNNLIMWNPLGPGTCCNGIKSICHSIIMKRSAPAIKSGVCYNKTELYLTAHVFGLQLVC